MHREPGWTAWARRAGRIWQRGLLAGGAGLMAAACLAVALWAAFLFPPAGWLCYLLALGWSLLGSLCLSGRV